MRDYKTGLKEEKHIGSLDDDYIKFIRFAQWKIDQNGQGIVGLITNNSYLDGIIHRQMRKSLLNSFDRIYILNLHGSTRKDEKLPPNISKDKNVFDIQQGVAIALSIKNNKFKDKKVFYFDLYGTREEKYRWLDRNRVDSVKWQELKPEKSYYFFVPKDFTLQKEYEKYWRATDVFKEYSSGVVTGKDKVLVKFTVNEIEKIWKDIFNPQKSLQELERTYGLKDTSGWKVSRRRKNLLKEEIFSKNKIIPYAYRPFDDRFIFYSNFLQRLQKRVIKHLTKENIALVTNRRVNEKFFNHIWITDKVGDKHIISDQSYFFPLYLYEEDKKQPNFTDEFIEFIEKQYPDHKPIPEDILGYIYAVLHSPMYRQDFNEFLKIDFPRIPFVNDYEKFKHLSKIGKELVELHLMKKTLPTHVKFDVQGSNIVKSVKYKDNKIYINKEQFFEGIPKEVWNFYIGGYQVLNKWLKSRKNRELSSNEIEHFLQVIEIIRKTIGYMRKIEEKFNA